MRFPPVAVIINPFASRACTDSFPFFDHATWAEVLRREELNAMWRRGEPLSSEARGELQRLNRKARPPIYDPPGPQSAA